ncbi:MAG: HAD family phosphatase [Spirochaetales bacterium]|nr:HAD family phosphatase [Spirochaetales bacterium]
MIQLIALDLDDTLLKTDLTISERNLQAIKKAEERGILVVLASGRTIRSMQRYVSVLGLDSKPGYIISDNGSTLSSTLPAEILVSHVLESSLMGRLFEAFEKFDLPVQVYHQGKILVTKENPHTHIDEKLSGYQRLVNPRLKHEIPFLPSKLVIPGDPEILPGVLLKVREQFGHQINAFISKPYFLEVLPAGADKGSALQAICERTGIPSENVLAFGDAANDLGMIRWAGWGVAMANAIPELKLIARLVTRNNNENDGVAEILEQYVLSSQPIRE